LLPVAISPNGVGMKISLSDVEVVLRRMHGVPKEHRNAMLARLQYLFRLGFPFVREKRLRSSLDLDSALRLATVFELIQAGQPPIRAARMVRSDWALVLREAIAEAWWSRRAGRRTQAEGASKRLLAVTPDALAEFARSEIMTDVPLNEAHGLLDLEGIDKLLGGDRRRTVLAIDVGRMAAAFGEALEANEIAPAADFDRAMMEFCADAFGSDDRRRWPHAE